MKMLVIGSSDTAGTSLPDPTVAWPAAVGRELGQAAGEPVEVIDLPVFHQGPKAVPRVVNALDRHQPDLVIFAFGAYAFIVGTVGQRVRRRYGERAHRLFRRIEVRFEGKTANAEGRPARLNHAGRWLARRVIGAEPTATREEVTAIQTEIMRELARREGVTVVVLFAPPVAASVDRENRGANRKLAEHRDRMTALGRAHRFLIADCLPGFAAATAGLRHSDGVHKGAAGHRIQADAVMAALLTPPSPYAPTPAAETV
ncbi:MAG: hypothetical protein IT302_10890 [Dehalococcoidia bacterium]|nr:hypothetical protein [Dehalococcoidia bacterium]